MAMTNPIPPERFASWRTAVAEMAGPRRAEFAAARRRQGIDRQIVWVQQTPEGPREILLMETADPARAFLLMATSQDPFDVWFRQVLVDTFGIDLTRSPDHRPSSSSTGPRRSPPEPGAEALDLGRWLGCPRRCGRRPTSGRSSGRRDPPTLRLSYADGFGVLRAALTVCTDRGFAVNDIDVTREDLDDAGNRPPRSPSSSRAAATSAAWRPSSPSCPVCGPRTPDRRTPTDYRRGMLDVHRLRLLRELRHRGTLAAVARALGYSPSTISHQLDVLEREAGVPLLEPVGRRVQLTAEALLLVDHAEAVLERLERAEADLAAARGEATGTLRLATFQTVAHSLVIDLLGRLEGGPLVLDITHLTAQRALEAVLAGDFDMVLAEEFPGAPMRFADRLEAEEVCRDPLLLAVPDGWDPDDLAAMPWAVETAASPAQGWALRTCRAAGFEPIVRYRSDDVLLHVRLVQAGRAAAFLPELVRRCGFPEVRLRPLPGPPQYRRIFTAVRAGSSRHPAVQRVRRGLRQSATVGGDGMA